MLKQEKYPAMFCCLVLVTVAFVAAVLHFTAQPSQKGAYTVAVEHDAQAVTAPQRVLLDINSATAAQLEELNGIGAVLAGNIVEYREKNGNFTSVDELLKVEGIGEKTLAEFRHEITLGGELT